MRVVGVVVAMAVLAAGCAAGSDSTPTGAPFDGVRGDLEAARFRWEDAGVATYRYIFENDCGECDPSVRAPHEVVVWSGARFDPGDRAPSVEEMFSEIERALDENQSVSATFDPDLGYPTDLAIDLESLPMDGGSHWVVQNLEPGLPGDPVSGDIVSRAEQKWLTERPDAYEYTLTVFCDCPLEGSLVTRISGNKVTSHEILYDDSSGGSVTPMSIDHMFSDLAELMAAVDGVVEDGIRFEGSARFDPDLGYPTWVGLDITVLEPDSVLAQLPSQLVITITDLHAIDAESQPEPLPTGQLDDLNEARGRWQLSGIAAYRYELTFHMMMTAEFTGPFVVTVVDGVVTEVTREGVPVSAERVSAITVEELFLMIEDVLLAGIESEVTYHEIWGHPVLVALNLDAIAVDGGLMLSLSDLAPVE